VTCDLVFIKIAKCASTTNSGVARKIGQRLGLTGVFDMAGGKTSTQECRVFANHAKADGTDINGMNLPGGGLFHRDEERRKTTYLYTFVRLPEARAISSFFWFQVGLKKLPPDDNSIIQYLQDTTNVNYMTKYVSLRNTGACNDSETNLTGCVLDILSDYDFIGITERENESLVAMKFLMRLDMADIVHLNSKDAGSGCGPRSFRSSPVQAYLESDFRLDNKVDIALYEAVNRSLDATISWIGNQVFQDELAVFEQLLQEARQECSPPAADDCFYMTPPCGCGCGHSCIDTVLSRVLS